MVYEEFVSIHIQVFYFFGCENHSTEDMIDLVQKICSNCGLPNILTQDNKCADCNTYAEVKVRVRLAKQLRVKNILEENNIPYET